MKRRVLDVLQCPISGTPLTLTEPTNASCANEDTNRDVEIECGRLTSEAGHTFPIRAGVPRLLPDLALTSHTAGTDSLEDKDTPGRAIGASFGREWQHFDPETSRTWHDTLDERCDLFLKEVDCSAGALPGKWVLDAGCGNGSLSHRIAQMGCDVLATDVADSVEAAHRYYATANDASVHFVQMDLMNPAYREGVFDIVYASGVLHHNPDTRQAFEAISKAVAPGGKIYIWVYHHADSLKFRLQLLLRRLIAPLPAPVKHGFVRLWSVQSMLRQHVRTLLGLNDAKDRLTWRERTIDLMDIYTPRYRWMHSQDEVKQWYQTLGFEDVKVTEVRDWGFGVVGTRPATSGSADTAGAVSAQTAGKQ